MDVKKFMSQVEQSEEIIPVGIVVDEMCMVVKHAQTGVEIKLPTKAIEESDWETLYDVMIGKREPTVLQHMTRVVGYYSKIENWNPSKLGELKNRQEGNYEL